jgi:signal transduction histidine kinase
MQVTCEVTGRVFLPVSSRQHVLAIIQEALINAQRHGSTKQATISLQAIEEDTIVKVSDEGVGFDQTTTPREERYGLTIMEERAQIAGGQIERRGICETISARHAGRLLKRGISN